MTFQRDELLERSTALCEAFATRKSLDDILDHFAQDVVCFEHGLPQLAPFLGRMFHGLEGARDYFQLIGDLLDFQDMKFSDYMVDVETRQVSVRGEARFIWKSTQNSWDEVFMYRLKFNDDNKISSYKVWADSGAAYLARRGELRRRVVLVTYEFTYSSFSGNGILARSIVKSLLHLGCQVTVWCCQPHEEHSSTKNSHIEAPEISKEAQQRLTMIPVQLDKNHGWRKLDDESAWEYFQLDSLDSSSQNTLRNAIAESDVVCAIDWTGAHAFRSLHTVEKPLLYMNFRVYSSGVVDDERRLWFNDMERKALDEASSIIALSEQDRTSLEQIAGNSASLDILLPPLRGDMQELAHKSAEELSKFLPAQVASSLGGKRLLTCVVRLSKEKHALRFVRFVEQAKSVLDELGLIPLLAGATADELYATSVKEQLTRIAPNAILVESFLSPSELAGIFSKTALNFHPCAYDAYGMTIVEAAACGVPSVFAVGVGASALIRDACLSVDMPLSNENELSTEAAQAVVDLLQDSNRLERMGGAAKKRALEWDEIAYGENMLGIIAKLLENK